MNVPSHRRVAHASRWCPTRPPCVGARGPCPNPPAKPGSTRTRRVGAEFGGPAAAEGPAPSPEEVRFVGARSPPGGWPSAAAAGSPSCCPRAPCPNPPAKPGSTRTVCRSRRRRMGRSATHRAVGRRGRPHHARWLCGMSVTWSGPPSSAGAVRQALRYLLSRAAGPVVSWRGDAPGDGHRADGRRRRTDPAARQVVRGGPFRRDPGRGVQQREVAGQRGRGSPASSATSARSSSSSRSRGLLICA